MPLDFCNVNTLWASLLVETLYRLGLTTAIVCPGSRSAPLAVAFARHPHLEAIPILDERSAAFFALGVAKQSGLPAVLVCTSGTAGANFYPAIIEAKESYVPLLVLTADRPPELRHCHAGQTTDQLKLYGTYPNWQAELALPAADITLLRYLRQTMVQAWEHTLYPDAGPVHLNVPFREPLAPIAQGELTALKDRFQEEDFFTNIVPDRSSPVNLEPQLPLQQWQSCQRGIIIGGVAAPQYPQAYCQAIAQLSAFLQYPVLAEALSPLRNYAETNAYLIATYDLILRNRELAQQLAPEVVIQLGELPTSKELRAWLETIQPQRWVIDRRSDNFDPLHGKTWHLRTTVEQIATTLAAQGKPAGTATDYLKAWCYTEANVRQAVDQTLQSVDWLLEGKTAWLLSQILPPRTPLIIANSMPVRDMEFFWMPRHSGIMPYFNRGANGIDGTLSTALGIAQRQQSSVLLTGDLALLHDTNGFLSRDRFVGHLTIVLINNNGGGIFEMLPIAQFNPPFEDYFATPQNVDFACLCATYGVEYQQIRSWEGLKQQLNPLPETGIRVLELPTDRKADALWLQKHLQTFAQF